MRRVGLFICLSAALGLLLCYLPQMNAQEPTQNELRKQIGTIIVTPGSGPALAVADFQPRAGGVDAPLATFNEVLWNDLKFAGIANLVGKSKAGAVAYRRTPTARNVEPNAVLRWRKIT